MKKKLLLAPLMAVLVACVVVLSGCGGPSVEELITEDLTTQFDEVKNGGEFQFKNGVSLRDAVAMAGGYTYRADQSYIYIGREGEADVAVRMPTDVPVLPGDNIRIPERFF